MKADQASKQDKLLEALPHVRRFAISLSGSYADGDDLLQATVERVLKKGTPEDVDMKKWMFRICKNLWIDGLRGSKVRREAAQGQDITIHNRPDGETVIMDRLKLAKVMSAMNELPSDQRVVLSLVAIEGCSYREVSEILETPIGTVMSRVARARQNLAAQFAGETPAGSFTTTDAFKA